MKNLVIYKFIRDAFYYVGTLIARILPLWKVSPTVEVLPPIISLPVALPLNYNKLPQNFAKQFIKFKTIPTRRIFILKEVYISGEAVVFKNFRVFLSSLPWLKDLDLYRNGKFLVKQWLAKVHYIPNTETVALIYDQWSAENYYHWMIESLPRLFLVQEKYPQCLLIIPDPAPEFIRTTLSLLGFTKILPLKKDSGPILKVSNLVLPELVYYYEEEEYIRLFKNKEDLITNRFPSKVLNSLQNQNEELIVTIRRKLLSHFSYSNGKPTRKIFVSRSRQKTRRLINEKEVLPILDNLGFELIYFEGMTFQEQVSLMQKTAVFIGLHGANLVNILFMPTGSKVIEMMNEDYLNDAYYLLSSTIHLPYYSIPCKMADPTITQKFDTVGLNDADLVVDITELEEVLNICISSTFN